MITIAHISDIHYNPGDTSSLSSLLMDKGLDVSEHLRQCLNALKERRPDIVALTGDITHEGTADTYRYIREEFNRMLPGVPVLCSMGNHDRRAAFREGFLNLSPEAGLCEDVPYVDCLSLKGFRFLSIDSAYEKGIEGVLTDDLMDRLEEMLIKPAARGNILLLHHPVLSAAKSMSLTMTERFADLLKSEKIKALLCGHVHGSYIGTVYGTPQFTADSLKTGCDLLGDVLTYNDRAGYQIITFDKKNDWNLERFLIRPKSETLLSKAF